MVSARRMEFPSMPTFESEVEATPTSEDSTLSGGGGGSRTKYDAENKNLDDSECHSSSGSGSDKDGAFIGSSNSSKSSSNEQGDSATMEMVTSISKKESKNVRRTKWLVYGVLGLAAAGIGFAVYYVLSTEEQDDFELQVSRRFKLFLFLLSINQLIPSIRKNYKLPEQGQTHNKC